MRTLPDLRAYFEGTSTAQAAQIDGGAGLVAGDAPERILGTVRSGAVEQWLRRVLGDSTLATRVEENFLRIFGGL